MRRLSLLLFFAILASACGSTHHGKSQSPVTTTIVAQHKVDRDVVVSPEGWPATLLADVYRPLAGQSMPGVLLVHGGAWKRGERDQVEKHALALVRRGYVVVNTTYRLVPEAIFPAQLKDVQQAVRWMREHGEQYGIDVTRIGGFGYSAGAHLVSLTAAAADHPELGVPGTSMKAIVAGGNPSDLTRYEGGYLVPNFLGGTRDEIPETFRAASPVSYVKPGHPPVFQYHATLDGYVPFEQAELYREALNASDVPNELFVLHGHGHISAFFADGDAIENAILFLDRYLR